MFLSGRSRYKKIQMCSCLLDITVVKEEGAQGFELDLYVWVLCAWCMDTCVRIDMY